MLLPNYGVLLMVYPHCHLKNDHMPGKKALFTLQFALHFFHSEMQASTIELLVLSLVSQSLNKEAIQKAITKVMCQCTYVPYGFRDAVCNQLQAEEQVAMAENRMKDALDEGEEADVCHMCCVVDCLACKFFWPQNTHTLTPYTHHLSSSFTSRNEQRRTQKEEAKTWNV